MTDHPLADRIAQQRRALAEQIARDLFTNGAHQRADRLVLTIDGPPKRDLGGWSERAVVNLILAILVRVPVLPPVAEPEPIHE